MSGAFFYAKKIKKILERVTLCVTFVLMIESIQHKGLKLLWEKDNSSKIPATQILKIKMILTLLDSAINVEDMNFPGSGLHPLRGDLAGFWSVKVNGNYRLIFRFENENAFDVDYIDYH